MAVNDGRVDGARLDGEQAGVDDTAGDTPSGVTSRQAGWNSTSSKVIHILMDLPTVTPSIHTVTVSEQTAHCSIRLVPAQW